MTEDKKKRRRVPQTYKHHAGAFCISVYDPQGQPIPGSVRKQVEDAVHEIVMANKLLHGIATT
jgi:hypothetical protein